MKNVGHERVIIGGCPAGLTAGALCDTLWRRRSQGFLQPGIIEIRRCARSRPRLVKVPLKHFQQENISIT